MTPQRRHAGLWILAGTWVAAVLVGCATEVAPALKEGDADADVGAGGGGMALIGVTLVNTFRVSPLIAPIETAGLFVDGPQADPKPHGLFIKVDKPLSHATADGRQLEEQTVTIGLPPGKYRLRCVQTTVARVGWGCAPVFADFEIVAGTVSYLGHLDVLRRERKSDTEIPAGGPLPFFDQWYSGYSTGTFDVAVRDASDIDIPHFKSRYPALNQATTIANAVLPPLRQPTAAEAAELP